MSAADSVLHLQTPRRVNVPALHVRGVLRSRQAVRIRLLDGCGGVGLGEALPLTGYSRDDASAAEAVLSRLAAQTAQAGLTLAEGVTPGPAQIEAALAPHAAALAVSPSARFALECALLDLLSRRARCSAAAWLAQGRALQPVPVSQLLPDDDASAPAAAAAAVAQGFRVLKLKIARADRSEAAELELLAAVREAAQEAAGAGGAEVEQGTATADRVQLRLDANGALAAAGLLPRLLALACHGIELVEEPLAGAALLSMPVLPLPWAADESLRDAALATALLDLPSARAPVALVLKPAELGLLRCLALARQASARGVGVIVTHSLDADLGHAAARALAAALPVPPLPCGLAAHPGLRHPSPPGPRLPEPIAPGLGVAEDEALT